MSIKELIEQNITLTVLGLILAGFVAGASTVVFLDARSPPTVPKTEFDEIVQRNSELESLECPETFESELGNLKDEYRQLESKQCPRSYKNEYDSLSKRYEEAEQSSDRRNEASQKYIKTLESRNEGLQEKYNELKAELTPKVGNIADFDSIFVVNGEYESPDDEFSWQSEISWKEIFSIIAPYLEEHPHDDTVNAILERNLVKRENLPEWQFYHDLDDQDFRTIALQLEAYGLVETRMSRTINDSVGLFWYLTPKGEQILLDTRVVQ